MQINSSRNQAIKEWMLVLCKLPIFKWLAQMRTSIKDSTRRVDPVCPSKSHRSLPVPFLEDLNKNMQNTKKYTLSWKKKIGKTRESFLACYKGKWPTFAYKTLKLIALKAYSVIFNMFSRILMSNFNIYLLTYTWCSIILAI